MQQRFKKLIRKVDRIEYTNTDFPNGYEEVQIDYRLIKKRLESIKDIYLHIMTYEHGGDAFKTTKRAIEIVSKKIKPEMYEMKSFFKRIEELTKEISFIKSNDNLKMIASKYSESFLIIENEKNNLNLEFEKIIKDLKELQNKFRKIDDERAEILNLRYDLEKLYQKNADNEKINEMKNLFHSKAILNKENMENFIGDNGLALILKNAAEMQGKFYEAAAKALKNVLK